MSRKRLIDPPECEEGNIGENCRLEAVIFPDAGELRSRKVVSRSNSQSAGKYPSWKMRRMVHWESLNELNAFRLLDCDPRVWRFSEQPCRIVFTIDGIRRIHFPDVLVIGAEGKQLWEIKTRCKSMDSEVLRRTELLSKALHLRRVHAAWLPVCCRMSEALLSAEEQSGRRVSEHCERLAGVRCHAAIGRGRRPGVLLPEP
jgi:hypothetical protein